VQRLPTRGVRAARGARRWLGDVRPAAARDPRREGGPEPAALPVGARAAAGEEEGGRASRARSLAIWRAGARRGRGRGRREQRDPGADEAAAPAPGRGTYGRRGDRAGTGRSPGRRRPAAENRGARAVSGAVIAFVEHDGGEPDRLSLEALGLARGLAQQLGAPLDAI